MQSWPRKQLSHSHQLQKPTENGPEEWAAATTQPSLRERKWLLPAWGLTELISYEKSGTALLLQESKARSFMEVARETFEIQNEHCEKIQKYETGRMLLITITE